MTQSDLVALMGEIFAPTVAEFVGEYRAQFREVYSRLAAIEAMGPAVGAKGERGEAGPVGQCGEKGERGEQGERGERGENGRDVDPDLLAQKTASIIDAPIREFMTSLVKSHIDGLLPSLKGAPGKDGVDGTVVTIAEIEPVLEGMVANATARLIKSAGDGDGVAVADIEKLVESCTTRMLEQWPRPADGQPGRDGKDGEAGPQGERGETGPPGERGEKGDAGERGEAGPPGDRGEKGDAGDDGKEGRDGQPGVPGRDGKDGDRGIDGKDGAPGRDGLDLDDLSVEQIGERTLRITLGAGEIKKTIDWRMQGLPIYKGSFEDGREYDQSDEVTYGGQVYIAVKDKPGGRPGDGSNDWHLRTRKGRDGKDGNPGKPGDRGPPGPAAPRDFGRHS